MYGSSEDAFCISALTPKNELSPPSTVPTPSVTTITSTTSRARTFAAHFPHGNTHPDQDRRRAA